MSQSNHLYGINPVYQCLLNEKRKLYRLFIRKTGSKTPRLKEILDLARKKNLPIKEVDPQVLEIVLERLVPLLGKIPEQKAVDGAGPEREGEQDERGLDLNVWVDPLDGEPWLLARGGWCGHADSSAF